MSDDACIITLPEPIPGFITGDWLDMLTGAIIVGPYCEWPKRKARTFVVTQVGEQKFESKR